MRSEPRPTAGFSVQRTPDFWNDITMKRPKLRMIAITILAVVVLGALGLLAFLQHPLFGTLPDVEQQARFANSSNFLTACSTTRSTRRC